MYRIRRVTLIALMLFNFAALFAVQSGTALAASEEAPPANNPPSPAFLDGYNAGKTAEYAICNSNTNLNYLPAWNLPLNVSVAYRNDYAFGWLAGVRDAKKDSTRCPALSASTTSQDERNQGYNDGLAAGQTPGSNAACPRGKTYAYCVGWREGYADGLKQREGGSPGIPRSKAAIAAAAGVAIVTAILNPIHVPAR